MASGTLALVTGATSALGAAIASELAQQGHDLLLHDYVPAEEVQASIQAAHGDIAVSTVTGDILEATFVGKLFDALGGRRIGVFAHAGGVAPLAKDANPGQIFQTNFTATRKIVETLQPRMEEGGVIVLVASAGGTLIKNSLVDLGANRHARGGWSPTVWLLSKSSHTSYAVAKRCIQLYVKEKAAELSPLGVRIVSVSPGLVETTETQAHADDPAITTALGHTALRRLGKPEEIAPVVAFLASPGAAYITGTDITVDGGLTSQRWKTAATTANAHFNNRLEKMQQRNAERTRQAHQRAQTEYLTRKESVMKKRNSMFATATVPKNGEGEGAAQAEAAAATTEAAAEGTQQPQPNGPGLQQSSSVNRLRSAFGSLRERFEHVQEHGFGSQAKANTAKAEETGGETAVTEGETANTEGETANTETEAIEEQQQQKPQPAKENGLPSFKSGLGSIRARLDKMQQNSVEKQKKAHEETTTAAAAEAPSQGTTNLKSSFGTLRSKLKSVQEKNAARARAAWPSAATKTDAAPGILQPIATEPEGEAAAGESSVKEVKEDKAE